MYGCSSLPNILGATATPTATATASASDVATKVANCMSAGATTCAAGDKGCLALISQQCSAGF